MVNTESYAQTWCEVCEIEGEPLTLVAFGRGEPFLVCRDCAEAHEEMERDDPELPHLMAVGA